MTRPTLISLFSGAGGLDLGLEKAGFEVKVCVEKVKDRCQSIKENRPHWNPICADIRELSTQDILNHAGLTTGEVGLVSGGPPCQSFSKSAFWVPGRLNQIVDTSHVRLLEEFVRILRETKATAYIFENVQGLAYKTSQPVLNTILSLIEDAGYTSNVKVLNAADYGVPQKRKRLFIIGARDDVELSFPQPTHSCKNPVDMEKMKYITAGEAIGDLDDSVTTEQEKVRGKWGYLLPEIPPGENYLFLTRRRGHPNPRFKWRSRYWSFLLKLSPDEPSWTVQAQPGPYIGPFHWRNRKLRILEIKRLQTFPDEWLIVGDEKEKWAQIGNAVPPLLAQKIGESILEQLVQANLFKPNVNTDQVVPPSELCN